MKIIIEIIPHKEQRYNTTGDWYWEGEDLYIKASKTEDWRSAALIAAHELIEVLLCKNNGVTQQAVDDFDMKNKELDEPGDHLEAPYGREHCFSVAVERMLCAAMNLAWEQHARNIEDATR